MRARSVLVTGGTGYFGRHFIQHLLQHQDVLRVCVFSRDEAKQAQLRLDLENDARLRWFVGCVRDRDRLRRAMEGVDLVIHAAALKRIEVGEYNPVEMVKTNVVGAMNVIEAASDSGVRQVVALSTDKACAPVNCYGATKLTMEKLLLAANSTVGTVGPKFSVVRYGNVAGSTGSVIPVWRSLIAAGKDAVPVTDPDCTRFWMSVDEAVRLVLWVAEHGRGGELVVPVLPAYRLCDLARALKAQMRIVGLTKGEKRHEEMIGANEAHEFRAVNGYCVRGWGTDEGLKLPDGLSSDMAERLTIDELRERLRSVA